MSKKGAQRVVDENKKRIRVLTALVAVSIVSVFECLPFSQPRPRPSRLFSHLSPPSPLSNPLIKNPTPQLAFFYARFVHPSSPKARGRHFLGFAAASAVSSLCLLALKRHAEPLFDNATGSLLHGGGDLSEPGGMTSTMHDAVYICSAALLVGSRYDAALFLLFLPFFYGLFKLWTSVLSPWIFFTPTAREAGEGVRGGGGEGGSSSSKRGRGVMPRSGGSEGGGGGRRR